VVALRRTRLTWSGYLGCAATVLLASLRSGSDLDGPPAPPDAVPPWAQRQPRGSPSRPRERAHDHMRTPELRRLPTALRAAPTV